MPTLDQLRAKLPELQGLDDGQALDVIHQVYYPTVDKGIIADRLGMKIAAPVDPNAPGDFARGFKKAMYQIPQTAGGALALGADMVGADGVRDYGMGVYKNYDDKINAISKPSDSLSSVLQGEDGATAGGFLKNAAGYTAGQALTALATGGLGGIIGKQLALRGIGAVAARAAESQIARQVAEKVASRGVKYGAGAALFGSNLMQEAGSIYPDAVAQANADGRTLDGGDLARVAGSATLAAGVDTAMDAFVAHKVLNGGRRAGEGLARAALREVPGMAAKEAATEGIQTGIERYGAQQDMSNAEAVRDYVDSMGVGAVGGGLGGGVSVLHAQKVPESGPLSRAANVAIDAQAESIAADPDPVATLGDGSAVHKADLAAYLNQFATPEQRTAAQNRLMGLDENGKPVEEAPTEPPKFAASPEQEQATLKAWGGEHKPATLKQALALKDAPGAPDGLMVAPHPDGRGYTLVPSNWLTLDSQAKFADLQKAAPANAKPKKEVPDEAVAKEIGDGAGGGADAVRAGQTEPARPGAAGPGDGGPAADDAAAVGKGDADPVHADPAANAQPALSEPEWKTNPYTAYKYADRAAAEKFFANKKIDPEQFHVTQNEKGAWVIKAKQAEQAVAQDNTQGGQFTDEVTGAHSGQTNHTMTMKGEDGKPVGSLDYTIYQGKPQISMINVPQKHRRKGYGTALVMQLQKQFPDTEIDWGSMTDDGAKLRASLHMQEHPSEHTDAFQRLSDARAKRDELMAQANEFQKIDHPTDAQRAKYQKAVAPLNDLHDEIDTLERELDGERPTKAIIAGRKVDAISAAAHEAATSPQNDLPEPTQAQKEAGNYKLGHVQLHGLDVSIENPAGSVRRGTSPDGKAWENTLEHHYGYIKKTLGADGDHVDAFIGPNPASERAYVVDQVDPKTGKFDEHKILLGFDSKEDAAAGYHANYEKGWQGAKDISETSIAGLKAWLNEGDTTRPFAQQAAPLEQAAKPEPRAAAPALRDTRGGPDRFHGTSRPLKDGKPNNEYAMAGDSRNIYGQGFYTTDAADIAHGYMKKGKGGQPSLYHVTEQGAPRLYDMEQPMTPAIRAMAERVMGDAFPSEDIDGKPVTTLRQLFDEYRAESQNHGLTRDEVQEVFDAIRYNLEQEGYRGYRHIGGENTGNAPHDVRIYWTPEQDVSVRQDDIERYRGEAPKGRTLPAGAYGQQDGKGASNHLEAARDKHARQDEEVRRAAENIARRKAEKEAPAASAEAAPDPAGGIPKAFFKKVKVPHDVWVEDEQRHETVEVSADKALKSVREDIAALESLLNCMRG